MRRERYEDDEVDEDDTDIRMAGRDFNRRHEKDGHVKKQRKVSS